MDGYQPVEDRLREFHERFRTGRVITHMVSDPSLAMPGDAIIFRAELFRGDELRDTPAAATGYAHQRILKEPPPKRNGGPNYSAPEWTSPWEVAETSAVGRALANLGFAPKGQRPSLEEVRKADVMTQTTSPAPHAQADNAAQGQRPGAPSSDGGGGAEGEPLGEGPSAAAPPSDALAALLEAVSGSEAKAISAINKACSTAYRKDQLETLEPEDWQAGLALVRGGTK
jgi:hypothetical protein